MLICEPTKEDLGYVGKIVEVNPQIIKDNLDAGYISMVATVGADREGNISVSYTHLEGVYHFSVDMLEDEIKELVELGIEHVILFGVPDDNKKDCCGSEAYNDNGALQQGIRKIKEIAPQMDVICDVCTVSYTHLRGIF